MQTHTLIHRTQPRVPGAAAVALVVGLIGFGMVTSLAPSDQPADVSAGTVAAVPAPVITEQAVVASDPDQAPPPLGPVDVVPAADATVPCDGCSVESVRPVSFLGTTPQRRTP
jgi:hypothetical protein